MKTALRLWYKYRFLRWFDRYLRKACLVRISVHNDALSNADYRLKQVQLDTAALTESLDRILPKLVSLSAYYVPSGVYRICLDMDEFTIRDALIFGNDERFLGYFAERVGMMAERELKTINMQRFREPPFQRPEGRG